MTGTRLLFMVAGFCAAFGMGLGLAQAPAQICDLMVSETPGAAGETCLDLAALQFGGDALQTAVNATRIGKDGLKLCKTAFQAATPVEADIVFIYDNSGSMNGKFAYIDPVTRDTVFHNELGGCANTATNGSVTYNTLLGSRTIPQLVSNAGCLYQSGDPFRARGMVMRQAVDYIKEVAPTSTAGAVAFTGPNTPPAISHLQPPVRLGTTGAADLVKNSIVLDTAGATDYGPPLTQAYSWLTDPAVVKTRKQAIVFISDGGPDNFDYLPGVHKEIPIFGIFLGKPSAPYARLQELSTLTGGSFHLVSPKNIAEIQRVMAEVIKSIIIRNLPDSLIITNTSLAPPQSSRAAREGMRTNPDSSVSFELDSILALRQGRNEFTVRLVTGGAAARAFSFQVDATGPAAQGDNGKLQCRDQARMTVLNPRGGEDKGYPVTNSSYTIQLTRSAASDALPEAKVNATSQDPSRTQPWGDAESILLAGNGSGLFQRADFPFNGNSVAPIRGDGTLQASPEGKIVFQWVHPRDPREFASYELPAGGRAILELYAGGKPVVQIAADQTDLEIRLAPGTGDPCSSCRVQVQPSGSGDRESIAMAPAATGFTGIFTRMLSDIPANGDGKLQHLVSDSIVIAYADPGNPALTVRKAYPFQPPSPPALSLYHAGQRIDQVAHLYTDLAIRFLPPAGVPCDGSRILVRPSTGPDRESVRMSPDASGCAGAFTRISTEGSAPGDGILQHGPADSIVLEYANPGYPRQTVRVAYPFLPPPNPLTLDLERHNDVAQPGDPASQVPGQWYLVAPAGVRVVPEGGSRNCCVTMPWPLAKGDSGRFVGAKVEATSGFTAEVHVFSNLGQLVNRAKFSVPQAEFEKLPAGGKDSSRVMEILWGNRTGEGNPAATGAYVLRTTVKMHKGNVIRSQARLVGLIREGR